MAYQDIWENGGLQRVFTDTTSCEEILSANIKLYSDPIFDDIKFIINDFTRVLHFETSTQSMNEYVGIEKATNKSNHPLKVAMLVRDGYISAFARIYALRMEETTFQCETFENINDANSWIYGTDFIPQTECTIVTVSQERLSS